MKTKESELKVNDPRIDTALETKPFDEVFAFIKKYPKVLTLERLAKLIKRCNRSEDSDARQMEDLLDNRDPTGFGRSDSNKKNNHLWNEKIVLAMIEGYYFNEDYSDYKMEYLIKKYGGQHAAIRLGYVWCNESAYEHQRHCLHLIKSCFTPEYVQKNLEEGYYKEVLTLAALNVLELPKTLTPQQKEQLRKHLFKVVTVGYYETNFITAETYHKERIKRIHAVYAQCPDLSKKPKNTPQLAAIEMNWDGLKSRR